MLRAGILPRRKNGDAPLFRENGVRPHFFGEIDVRIADVLIDESAPERLVFESKTGPGRYGMGVVFACVAAWFAYGAIEARDIEETGWRWISILYNMVPAGFFALVAAVIAFGRERFTIDASRRVALLERGIGPANWARQSPLSQSGSVRVDCEKKRVGSTEHWRTQTVYAVRLPGIDWFDLTSVDDREIALSTATRLAGMLGYGVENLALNDGIERREG